MTCNPKGKYKILTSPCSRSGRPNPKEDTETDLAHLTNPQNSKPESMHKNCEYQQPVQYAYLRFPVRYSTNTFDNNPQT